MQAVSYDDAPITNVQTEDFLSIVHNYFGRVTTLHEGPQAFLVEMPDEGSTIQPHFHDIDQFQVIVGGSCKLGSDQAGPVSFHYADAYTPYGPIIGGKEGVQFYTIRASCATGFFPMPESRNKIPGKPGRNIYGSFDTRQPVPAAGQAAREVLMEDNSDGVKAIGIRLGAGASLAGEATNAGDQYYMVCAGSLVENGRECAVNTLINVKPGEAAPMLKAGAQGAQVLFLQLPRATERPGSRIKTLEELKATKYSFEGLKVD